MTPAEKTYYLERAEAELRLGEQADNEKAAWAHFQLAGRYFDLAHGSAPAVPDRMPIFPNLSEPVLRTG